MSTFLGSPLGKAGYSIALSHLEQLQTSKVSLGARPPTSGPAEGSLAELEGWTAANKEHIEHAVAKGAFSNGDKQVDWERVFLAFMESAATYLRDEAKLAMAVELYSKKTPGNTLGSPNVDAALQLYYESTADIVTLAQLWGMGYIMICDLPDKNKSGNIFIGPYCGCFYSLPGATKVPFMSIAFKGTNFADIGEGIVDFVYETFKAPNDRLFGANVSVGVYDSLFSQFDIQGQIASPWGLIQETLAKVVKSMPTGTNPLIHTTGHSLGASYACFAFAQLLTDLTPAHNSGQLGDIYTFGCPRVGYSDWSEAFYKVMELHKGTSVRVVNETDLVPQVVPLVLRTWPPYYNHVDCGWNIFSNAPPKSIETERGTAPPGLDWIWNWKNDLSDHLTDSYYASLQVALKGTKTSGLDS